MSNRSIDQKFMLHALELAKQAEKAGEVPVGAVIVYQGNIIGEGFNQPIKSQDCTAHAEIIALRQACDAQQNYRLQDCDMYVTLEPCAMCAGAIVHARVSRLVYAASDPKTGACGSVIDLVTANPTGHRVQLGETVYADQSRKLIQSFFQRRRDEKRQQRNSP